MMNKKHIKKLIKLGYGKLIEDVFKEGVFRGAYVNFATDEIKDKIYNNWIEEIFKDE